MKLFAPLTFGAFSLADIAFEGVQKHYVQEVDTNLSLEFDITWPEDGSTKLEVIVRAEGHDADKSHKFFKVTPEGDPIHYRLEGDAEDIYQSMDSAISADVNSSDLSGRATFSLNLAEISTMYDATEFIIDADYGAYSDTTSFHLHTFKTPVISAELLADTINENMTNDTELIQCTIMEEGYKPLETEFTVSEEIIIKIGDVELEHELDTAGNGTSYVASLTDADIASVPKVSVFDGATASCQVSYTFLNEQPMVEAFSDVALEFTYDPTFISFSEPSSADKLVHKDAVYWGAVGSVVEVTCESDGNPKPELQIAINGQSAAQGAGQDKTSKLTTTHTISRSQEQTATCAITSTNGNSLAEQRLQFDYHYTEIPVLQDTRVNVTKNTFRAGVDSKDSIQCSVDSRPSSSINYLDAGTNSEWHRDGLFTQAANLTLKCLVINDLSGEKKESQTLKITVLPPLVPEEAEKGGANIVVIIIVVLLVILLLGAIAFFVIKKRREKDSDNTSEGYTEGQPKPSESAGENV